MNINNEKHRTTNTVLWNDGNNARVLNAVPAYEEEPRRKVEQQRPVKRTVPVEQPKPGAVLPEQQPRRVELPRPVALPRPRAEQNIDFISMTFLVVAIAFTLLTCIRYLQVQSNTVEIDKGIKKLEQKLADLQNKNLAARDEVCAAVDFDEVYQVAVGDLGMVFQNQNEVILYEGSEDGYVRQYEDIPAAEQESILERLMP